MDDTTPEFRRMMRERFSRMSPEERVRLCAGMYDSARAIVEASLPAGLDQRQRRKEIYRRFYGLALAEAAYP